MFLFTNYNIKYITLNFFLHILLHAHIKKISDQIQVIKTLPECIVSLKTISIATRIFSE